MNSKDKLNCAFVGDPCVGKTTLLERYSKGEHDDEIDLYCNFKRYYAFVKRNGKEYFMEIIDSKGAEEYFKIRCNKFF